MKKNDGIYAYVKRYARDDDDYFADWHYKKFDTKSIYEKVMEITENNYEISNDAARWCKDADKGDIYEFREGEIEIIYID